LCTSGAGSIAGAILVAASKAKTGQARRSLLVMVLMGALMIAFGLSTKLIASTAFIFGAGMCLLIVFTLNSSVVQLLVPDQMRGRVMSVYNVAFRGGMPLGSLVSGYLIKMSSAPTIMSVNGLLILLLAFYFLFQRKLAKL